MALSEEDKKEIAEIIQREINGGMTNAEKETLKEAVRSMMAMRLEYPTLDEMIKSDMGYDEGDEKCPFFSERYLYPLLGKDDARSVLYTLKAVLRASGIFTEKNLWQL